MRHCVTGHFTRFAGRRPVPGLNYDDCQEFRGDSVSHKITWKDASTSALKGKLIRLEFYLQNSDLYTFRAAATDSPDDESAIRGP